MRDLILAEIRRLADTNDGQPPGKVAFTRATGIGEHQWSGVIWTRWSEALAEAGFAPNTMQSRLNTDDVLSKLIEACRHYGHVPTVAEMKMSRSRDPNFPSKGAIANHFKSRADLISALAHRAKVSGLHDIEEMLAREKPVADRTPSTDQRGRVDGFVYLLQSGGHYKIGRSDNIERRIKEVRVALPEEVQLIHAIKTDDPAGIEAYWHRRFADRRANGEWFRLSTADIAAFKRRTFQ